MEFLLESASKNVSTYFNAIQEAGLQIRKQKRKINKSIKIMDFIITLNSIEELEKVQKCCGNSLIVDFDNKDIWIYDGYME